MKESLVLAIFTVGLAANGAASAAGAVPPDTQNSRTTTATDGRVTTTTTYPPTPIIKTESGVLNSLKPRAPQLPLSEQIDLVRRNQADIAARRAADAAAAAQGQTSSDYYYGR